MFGPTGASKAPLDLGSLGPFVKSTVTNLGVKVDNGFKMDQQINSVVKSSLFSVTDFIQG